jgi:phospholipid/cholesterol/gamma-HCH transport system substrate-binding protein
VIRKTENTLNSLNAMLENIEEGKGTFGKMINDDEMYNSLTNASKELEELLREMKLNPKRFVHFSLFGKRIKPYSKENNQENKTN